MFVAEAPGRLGAERTGIPLFGDLSLGRVALSALTLVSKHDLKLRTSAGKVVHWYDRTLGVLYHPGPRTAVHRPWQKQLEDAKILARAASEFLSTNRHKSSHPDLYE